MFESPVNILFAVQFNHAIPAGLLADRMSRRGRQTTVLAQRENVPFVQS